jgi:hypothetical protein
MGSWIGGVSRASLAVASSYIKERGYNSESQKQEDTVGRSLEKEEPIDNKYLGWGRVTKMGFRIYGELGDNGLRKYRGGQGSGGLVGGR